MGSTTKIYGQTQIKSIKVIFSSNIVFIKKNPVKVVAGKKYRYIKIRHKKAGIKKPA